MPITPRPSNLISPGFPFRGVSLVLMSLLPTVLWACSGSDGDPAGPEGPGTLSVVDPGGLTAPAGTVVVGGPTFRLLDASGEPMTGETVQFEVVDGGGTVVASSAGTDGLGQVSGIWILGTEAGTPQRLRATYGSLWAEATAEAVVPDPGSTYLGRESYVEYRPGTLPLVLTAPHGGYMEPLEIPNRGWGTTAQDRNTRELTLAIREELFSRTGANPHVILSNLHRRKLDPNREIVEAAQGNPEAERAWWEFQMYAEAAGNVVAESHGEGLHLDIHGHAHEVNRVEIGYLLSRTDLDQPDGFLSGMAYLNKASIKALAEKPGNDLAGLIRGQESLGALLEERFVPAVPSPSQPDPGADDYFSGGYITERHGSRDGGTISAVQLEHHFPGLRDEEENRQRYAEALVDALLVYFPAHFGFELAANPALLAKAQPMTVGK